MFGRGTCCCTYLPGWFLFPVRICFLFLFFLLYIWVVDVVVIIIISTCVAIIVILSVIGGLVVVVVVVVVVIIIIIISNIIILLLSEDSKILYNNLKLSWHCLHVLKIYLKLMIKKYFLWNLLGHGHFEASYSISQDKWCCCSQRAQDAPNLLHGSTHCISFLPKGWLKTSVKESKVLDPASAKDRQQKKHISKKAYNFSKLIFMSGCCF